MLPGLFIILPVLPPALVAPGDELPDIFRERYGGLVTTVNLGLPPETLQDEAAVRRLVEAFQKM